MYTRLRDTAVAFIHSSDMDPKTGQLDKDRIIAIRTADYRHRWGHNYFKSDKPGLNHTLDIDAFIEHLESMSPNLKSVQTKVPDIFIDETRKAATVRSSFYMTPSGADETIENDIVWLLEMDQDGEKVASAIEFIDVAAAKGIGELVKHAKEDQGA